MSSGAVRVASGRLAVGDRLTAVPWFLSAGYGLVPIVMLAALLRLHNLQTVPELSDEMRDAIFSLPIARGESLPLANFSSYDSALFNYLEAIVFRVFGPDLRAPRVMMLVFGLLTTPLAFLCTRRAYGVGSAVLATAMLAVSPVHVIVNSRVAWGNCLTPLLTTVGFWLVYRAIRRASSVGRRARKDGGGAQYGDWNLVPAGFFFGLALQTHPTVLALMPGTALAIGM